MKEFLKQIFDSFVDFLPNVSSRKKVAQSIGELLGAYVVVTALLVPILFTVQFLMKTIEGLFQ